MTVADIILIHDKAIQGKTQNGHHAFAVMGLRIKCRLFRHDMHKNRIRWFGDVHDGEMELSPIGKITDQCWCEIPEHFTFVKLGEYIIMPDHVHGIIIIDKPDGVVEAQNMVPPIVKAQNIAPLPHHDHFAPRHMEAQNIAPLPHHRHKKNRFGPQSQNLASIIRGFKTGVTKNARLLHPGFEWQALYHDRIIRDEQAFRNISRYIKNNPVHWGAT